MVAIWVVWAIFLVELAWILIVAPRKLAALRAHWLDAAVVVVTIPLVTAFLQSLRLLRLARLLRLVRAGLILARAIQAERSLSSGVVFRLVALTTLFVVVIAGAAEAALDAGEFHSTWDGVWWATVSATTVGYGDLYPSSVTGRVIAIALMFVSIGFLAVLTATIASHFVKVDAATSGKDSADVREALTRIEAELAEIKAGMPTA